MSYQTCTKCKACKPIERFYFIKRSQKHDTRCKECVIAYQHERRATIPGLEDHERELQAKSYRERKKANPSLGTWAEKTSAQKKKMVEYVKRWRDKNRGQFNEEQRQSLQLRRSKAFQKAWPVIVHHYGGKCLSCGSAGKLCFDHVKPLSQRGDNLLTNGQPLCLKCNTFKGSTIQDKDHRPDRGEWIARLAKLNPWLVEPMPKGWWHKQPGREERAARIRAEADKPLLLPMSEDEYAGQVAQGVVARLGFQCVVSQDAVQNAQNNYDQALRSAMLDQ